MNEAQQDWEDDGQLDQDESDSDFDGLSNYNEEAPSWYEPAPLLVDAGDGVDDIFYIHHWEVEEIDSRVPISPTFITVHHLQKMRDWWLRRITEDVILRHTDRYRGKKDASPNCYVWKFRLRGCSPRDPNRWQLLYPLVEPDTIWKDDSIVGDIKCEVEYTGNHKGRCMIFMYLKSSSYDSSYNHIIGSYERYLTDDELDLLKIEETYM